LEIRPAQISSDKLLAIIELWQAEEPARLQDLETHPDCPRARLRFLSALQSRITSRGY
jgi:hypothetical protein